MYYIKPEWKQFVDRQHRGYYPILDGCVKAVHFLKSEIRGNITL